VWAGGRRRPSCRVHVVPLIGHFLNAYLLNHFTIE